uniref:Uncharacterized protein n=1 Tax=Utricularia reniformis TaxID=192314 RepID=A0A1Y0AZ61_9LAMI|nr:hypothetical protein AEK19_MT1992 [Utricularia reniformis]ART30421.1 hypothetical protein AEK19_MT1992 [Utricularia reniformis]
MTSLPAYIVASLSSFYQWSISLVPVSLLCISNKVPSKADLLSSPAFERERVLKSSPRPDSFRFSLKSPPLPKHRFLPLVVRLIQLKNKGLLWMAIGEYGPANSS